MPGSVLLAFRKRGRSEMEGAMGMSGAVLSGLPWIFRNHTTHANGESFGAKGQFTKVWAC